MWDERYRAEEYAFGTKPNEYLAQVLDRYPVKGKILFPAEGEGRNAVYAAELGLETFAFDLSVEGKKKALKLAKIKGVDLQYEVGDFFELGMSRNLYNAAALIYAHFSPELRSKIHSRIDEIIEPGGLIILEGFSINHLRYREKNPKVGGPNTLELLFSEEMIRNDFPGFEILELKEEEVDLEEGLYHVGTGKVIRFVGKKL